MSGTGRLPLPLVDALELDEARRAALRPGAAIVDGDGRTRRLPRWFYRVDAWQTAVDIRVAEHFTLAELMTVDVREAAELRRFPRYVPAAVVLLAAHLEVFRQAVGTYVYVAANGGYRSPAHASSDPSSPHAWGTAANIYRIGDNFLDGQERAQHWAEVAARVLPGIWIRPWGHEKGFADDHLHLDIGYVRLAPRGLYEEPVPEG